MSEADEIHSIKMRVESLTKGNWFQRNVSAVVMILVNAIAAVAFITTIGAQVNANTKEISKKVDRLTVDLELHNRDLQIDSLKSTTHKNQRTNEKLFEKLEDKIDKGNLLLQQILRSLPRQKQNRSQ